MIDLVATLALGLAIALFATWTHLVIASRTPTFAMEAETSAAAIPFALLFRAIAGPGLLILACMSGRIARNDQALAAGWLVAAASWAYLSGSALLMVA